jgi:hypothetical protein
MVCKEKDMDRELSNEGSHVSFIAVVKQAVISRHASEMAEPEFSSPMATVRGNEHHASLAEAL